MKTQEFCEHNGMLNQNVIRANERAASANQFARIGSENRENYLNADWVIKDWKSIMAGSPVFLLSVIFFICAIAEIVYSWEMYREFLGAFFGKPHWSIVILLGLVIVVGATYVSHLLSKSMSSNLFDLEVYNYQFISKKGKIQEIEAVEYIKKEKRKDLVNGILGAIILLMIVCLISWQRSFLMTDISGDDYSLVQKIFPVLIVLLEILSGIYIGLYLIPLVVKSAERKRKRKKTLECVSLCSKEDRVVTILLIAARKNRESYTLTKELTDSMYRVNYRSSNSLNYIDEINLKQIEVLVVDPEKKPVTNVQVVGYLPSNNSITTGITDNNGQLFLTWDSQDDYVNKIEIAGSLTVDGHFSKNNKYIFPIHSTLVLSK